MKNTRYNPATHAPLHTPDTGKQQAAERMSAEVEAYIKAGGTISKVTREAYRMSNIEREARRDKHEALREQLSSYYIKDTTGYEMNVIDEERGVRDALQSLTQGEFGSVDGFVDDPAYEGYSTVKTEPDFFRAADEPTDDEGVEEDE
jgi:hypothetical protein